MLLLWQRFILFKFNFQLYMKIYDCFMFFDEEMLLDLRLNILNKYVDKFVITEATYMHSGKPKKLIFDINQFSKFKDKIIYNVIDKQPDNIEAINKNDDIHTKGRKLIHNSIKRENYQREMAKKFLRRKITPVILGNSQDLDIANFISMNASGCINLVNKTTIQDLCCLARDAQLAIGNDTGPMHVFSMSGCHSLVLFSDDSNPNRCAPRSISKKKLVRIIQKKDLRNLEVNEVLHCLRNDFRYDF